MFLLLVLLGFFFASTSIVWFEVARKEQRTTQNSKKELFWIFLRGLIKSWYNEICVWVAIKAIHKRTYNAVTEQNFSYTRRETGTGTLNYTVISLPFQWCIFLYSKSGLLTMFLQNFYSLVGSSGLISWGLSLDC